MKKRQGAGFTLIEFLVVISIIALLMATLMPCLSLKVGAAAQTQSGPGGVEPNTPNIILFLVDDMGWQDTSVAFHTQATVWNELYRTPNMQRLADRGMRFTNAYAASPVCSPTRVSLITGKNPARTRVTDWVGHGRYGNRYIKAPAWASTGLQPGDTHTLPAILRKHGYRTMHVGKAHFGGRGTAGADPTTLGFDINIAGGHTGGPDRSYFLPWNASKHPGLQDYPADTYISDALTLEANKLIDQAVADNVPFFMNMAHYAVHSPLSAQGDPDYLGQYQDRPNPEDDYAALLESMDASLGAILDNLARHSIADNTIVIFFSDNGGLSNHSRNMKVTYTASSGATVTYQKDRHNMPIKGGKGAAYEGGLRVPMIVAWAGQKSDAAPFRTDLPIMPGSTSDCPVISDDLLPTVLRMAGLRDMSQYTQDIDGQDITPLFHGHALARSSRSIYFHYPHQWYRDIGVGLGIQPFTAMRKGNWKLVYFYGDGHKDGQGLDPWFELYDLAQDLGETENLLSSKPELARELILEMHAWMTKVGAQTPLSKANAQPVPLPTLSAL
jgi:prepilin-type N-terminal cleavage/methylation domain-containing protein